MTKRNTLKKAPSETPLGRIALMLEDVQTQVRSIAEGQIMLGDRLNRSIAELRAELIVRIEALEAAVRQNSDDIRKNSEDIRQNTEDIQALRTEMAEMRHEVQVLATRSELQKLEARVATLEAKMEAKMEAKLAG